MKLQLGNNKGSLNSDTIAVINGSASAIAKGAPAVFEMDGTDDGLSVHNASDAGVTVATGLLAGVAEESIAAGARGRVKMRGFVDNLLLIRATRAASTDSYATQAAIAKGDALTVDTVANGFGRSTAGAASMGLPAVVAIGTLASVASAASTSSDSSTAKTAYIDAYVRIM